MEWKTILVLLSAVCSVYAHRGDDSSESGDGDEGRNVGKIVVMSISLIVVIAVVVTIVVCCVCKKKKANQTRTQPESDAGPIPEKTAVYSLGQDFNAGYTNAGYPNAGYTNPGYPNAGYTNAGYMQETKNDRDIVSPPPAYSYN